MVSCGVTQPSWLFVTQASCLQDRSRLEACWTTQAGMPVLQHLTPFALVFEHNLAEQPNRRHPVAQQLVVEFLQ